MSTTLSSPTLTDPLQVTLLRHVQHTLQLYGLDHEAPSAAIEVMVNLIITIIEKTTPLHLIPEVLWHIDMKFQSLSDLSEAARMQRENIDSAEPTELTITDYV